MSYLTSRWLSFTWNLDKLDMSRYKFTSIKSENDLSRGTLSWTVLQKFLGESSLTTLLNVDCHSIGEAGWKSIVTQCPNLEVLTLYKCVNLIDSNVEIFRSLTRLEVLGVHG